MIERRHAASLQTRLRAMLLRQEDVAALVFFRVALGLLVMVSALRFLGYGWVDTFFIRPSFHFSYFGFAWLPRPSAGFTYALFGGMAGLGLFVALGLFYRASAAALFLTFTYLQLLDVSNYLNHYYLVSLLAGLMVFVPAHHAFSVDAWRRRAGGKPWPATLPGWCRLLLRFQVGIVYVNAGLAKATSDWLFHAQPLNIWLSARTTMPLIGPWLDSPVAAYGAAWAGFLFDTTVTAFLLWRRTRYQAFGVLVAFHVATRILFPPIGMFPVIMIVSALVFFDADWPRVLWQWGQRRLPRPAPARIQPNDTEPHDRTAPSARWRCRLKLTVACVYAAVQLVLPLRAHLYDGNVLWHEQGMRFSWRVMAREKNGSATFIVRHPGTGREWHVPPSRYLTRPQEREMAVQPDLILQMAHQIGSDFAARIGAPVEVRADSYASLNGRTSVPLIDPAVDLMPEHDGWGAHDWISPAPTPPPPHLRPTLARLF